ncbi:ankyrin repeat domain-containing protein 55-like isoform X2 [Rhopilema esculentum]|uniref:ankyrin repeat domain-containing protein 55-like isoform X2 n=1 Tax=Rhopilema esculentum TaxID=499914 RepID=UPI0031DFDA3B
MKDKQATIQDLEDLPPFHSAARQGHAEELAQLLAIHPDLIDYGDAKGFTPLMHAVFSKSMSCVRILLQFGSKPEIIDSKGRTALHFCARKGWSGGAEMLIKHGANTNTVDAKGRNALHFGACSYEESCMELLLSRSGNGAINRLDCEGMTPLHWASFHNVWDNVDLLLKRGVDPTIVDKENKTALHWAAQNGCAPVCKVLLGSKHCKGFINKKTNDGKTALHLAAIGGHLGVIFELAQGNTLDADLGDEEKRTALHWACAVGSDRCVAGLLQLGVRHDILDKYGMTALIYAKKLNHHLCVSLLEKFDPRRPQDVLIPMESLSDLNENMEKAADQKLSLSNLENDVFHLIPTAEKDHSQIDEIVLLHQEALAANQEIHSLAEAIGNVLSKNDRDSDSDFILSGDESSNAGDVTLNDAHHEAVISDEESRRQPQMAITPPNSFLHSPIGVRGNKKEKRKDIRPARKISKQSNSSTYKLAPIKTKVFNQQNTLRVDESPSSRNGRRSSSQRENARKISINSETSSEKMPKSPNKNEMNGFNWERPTGLRRKSLSMNEGLVQYAMRAPQKITVARTQSYAQFNPMQSILPVIDIRDGRNLTQRIRPNQFDNGYDGQDEVSHYGLIENQEKERRKKQKRKQRNSRYER